MGRKLGRSHEAEIDVELNITSIIDCFTVLITYLLVTASFISFGVLEVSVASPALAQAAPPAGNPTLSVTIVLGLNHGLEIRTEGEETRIYPVPAKDGAWDLGSVTEHLTSFKARFPSLNTAMVTADDTIEYLEVVKTVESVRETIPNVSLGAERGAG
jgi:biopolymer transport protein ExbD